MKLPNTDRAQVDRKKVTDYLLCVSHPDGAGKALFFRSFGFDVEKWEIFASALRTHAAMNPVVEVIDSAYGIRYSIDGSFETPDGRNPNIRTVWLVAKDSHVPRLITAHPI